MVTSLLLSDRTRSERTALDALVCDTVAAPSPELRGRLAAGTRAGDYELAEVIGRGAFGTVYRGVHPVIDKQVAIKVLDRSSRDDLRMEERFITEARAVNRVRHAGIVDIFGFGELESGQLFYVMELLVGENLASLIERVGPLPERVALQILDELAVALDAAHAAAVLHRRRRSRAA